MGCDIHVLTEQFLTSGKWFNADYWKYNFYYDPEDDTDLKMDLVSFFDDRNYELFATLANVRNGASIWEIMEGNADKCKPLPIIAEPKGLPSDLDIHTKEYIDSWGCDAHSHSFFTLKELYTYWINSPKTITRSGVLVGDVLTDFDEKGILSKCWFKGYIGSEKSAHRTWEVEYNPLDTFMEALFKRFDDVMWNFGYSEADRKSEKYQKIIEDKGARFRVVFFFDN